MALAIEKRLEYPLLVPKNDYEKHGMEDPRIVKIDDLFYLTYTAFDGINALSALAKSTDLKEWKRHGIIVPQMTYQRFNERQIGLSEVENIYLWSKNLVFFPKRINGKLCFLHRIKP